MNVIQRAWKSIRQQGLGASIVKLAGPVADRWFDRKYGTETCAISPLDHFTIDSPNKARGKRYEPSRVLAMRKMLTVSRQLAPDNSTLLDFGCGKGRVLLLAAEQGFRAVRGIEFAEELCGIARQNIAAFKAKTASPAEIEIIKGDATHYDVQPAEKVFFLFNPFDTVIFSKVLDNIAVSLKSHPRKLLIVMRLPSEEYRRMIEQRPEFAQAREFRFWGCDFSVYASCI